MRVLTTLALVACLLWPHAAWAQAVITKDPLSYSVRQYGFVLFMSLLGGLASWYAKVRKQEIPATNLFALVGELSTSAFSGLLAFFVCEAMDTPPLYMAAAVGIAGHMGNKAIAWAEDALKRRGERLLGVDPAAKE